jgi:hypothetical protein
MTNTSSKSARLDSAAVADAERLLAEMRREGADTSRDKLIRVLLWGVTAPQAVGMLSAFIRNAEARARAEDDATIPAVDEAHIPSARAP